MKPPVPMLVTSFGLHDPEFPVLVQPKLDGFRCLARSEEGGWVLHSRSGKVIDLPHITTALNQRLLITHGTILDGELYHHGDRFQRLQANVANGSASVQFHVFDLAGIGPRPAAERMDTLANLLEQFPADGPVRLVRCVPVAIRQQLERLYEDTLAAGYEGVIVRDPSAPYEHKRSWAVQKMKPHEDAEFLVIGHRPCAKRQHLTTLTCRNNLGSGTFDVVYPEPLLDPETVLDRLLTVRFSGRTDALLPRFAVAVRVRDEGDIDPPSRARPNVRYDGEVMA